jgi:hypothetical protein
MSNFSGVTLDYYDDQGATLKDRFPTPDQLPDVIKTASVQPKEQIPHDDFSLIMVDRGHVFRKYACTDAGTTAMSTIYFMEHGDKLPEAAKKMAAANLSNACLKYGLTPPAAMVKVASSMAEQHSGVDVTGQRPTTIVKQAAPPNDEDYAVVLQNGSRHYPIHTWDLVKKAETFFEDERIRMGPEIRRQFAKSLTKKAHDMGYPLNADIVDLGSGQYHSSGHLKQAIEMRKIACAPGYAREFLDELFEKHAAIQPEVYAECLRRFDVDQGLDRGWDHLVPDPWFSTFGFDKTAEVIWEEGNERVTKEQMENLAVNHLDVVESEFTDHMAEEFKKDPIGIFNSMPAPQKKLLARMADDSASYGGSENALVS